MKVMVVDDSALMRRTISDILGCGGHEVVTARTGAEALDKLDEVQPDAITLDINMPEMDGLTCLSRIMTKRPTPVVMLSSLTEEGAMATLEAMALGALDYVHKPGGTVSSALRDCATEILAKVEAAGAARVSRTAGLRKRLVARREAILTAPYKPVHGGPMTDGCEALTLIGASTGGPAVLEALLGELDADYPMPILVSQHMPANVTRHFAARLDEICAMPVIELRRQTELLPGHIYIARGEADMQVAERGGKVVASMVPASREHTWHPSVDRMVASAMNTITPDALIAVLLTGMGDDGAKSMTQLYEAGGYTIAESEETACVWGMPRALVEANGASEVRPYDEIAQRLKRVAAMRMRKIMRANDNSSLQMGAM